MTDSNREAILDIIRDRFICPLDLEVGITYRDNADNSIFCPTAVEVKGVVMVVTTAQGTFRYGGLYRGLLRVTPHHDAQPFNSV